MKRSPSTDATHAPSSTAGYRTLAITAATLMLGTIVVLSRAPSSGPADTAPALGAAEPTGWEPLATADGSHATARHEAGGVVIGEDLYLLGGRRRPPIERFSTTSRGWRDLGAAPLELHHFQPVAIDGRIHVVGAFTCCYPNEPSVQEIHVFDTRTETWDIAGTIPVDRARGSAGAVVRDGLLYVIGGNNRGHDGGAVPWFDVWDPASGEWTRLPDAPHARDHFQAALVGDQLVAAGGRTSRLPNPSANPVLATDVYDFASGEWRTVASIPTPRAGTVAVAHGDEAIVIGGELNTEPSALDAVEAFDVTSDTWRSLPSLDDGRHGSGSGVVDGTLHIVAGATNRGGSGETNSHETLRLGDGNGDGGADDGGADGSADGGVDGGTDGNADGGVDGGTDGNADGGVDGGTDGNADGGVDGGTDGNADGGADGGTDGSADGGTDGGTDGQDAGGDTDGVTDDGPSYPGYPIVVIGGGNDDDGMDTPAPKPVPAPAPAPDPDPAVSSSGGSGGGNGWGLALALLPALALRRRRVTVTDR